MKDKKDNISNIKESRQRLDQDDTVDKELNSHTTLTSSAVKKTSEAKIIRMDTDAYLYRSILNRRME